MHPTLSLFRQRIDGRDSPLPEAGAVYHPAMQLLPRVSRIAPTTFESILAIKKRNTIRFKSLNNLHRVFLNFCNRFLGYIESLVLINVYIISVDIKCVLQCE